MRDAATNQLPIGPPRRLGGAGRRTALTACVVGTLVTVSCTPPTPAPAPTPAGQTSVKALGRLEPLDGVVVIGGLVGDRIDAVLVKEGQAVKRGDLLVVFASRASRRLEHELAVKQLREAGKRVEAIQKCGDAQAAEAQVRVEQVERLDPLEIKCLESKIGVGEKQVRTAQINLKRLKDLSADAVSPQEMERQELALSQAEGELDNARALLEKARVAQAFNARAAKTQLATVRATVARGLAEIPLESLEQNEQLARERLKLSEILAPSDGVVLDVFARPGEMVGPQPLLRIADLRETVAVAEVYETDVLALKPGMKATVSSRALSSPHDPPPPGGSPATQPTDLPGEIVSIGRQVGRNRVFDISPAENADRRVVEVKVKLKDSDLAARFLNLQVLVTFRVE